MLPNSGAKSQRHQVTIEQWRSLSLAELAKAQRKRNVEEITLNKFVVSFVLFVVPSVLKSEI